MRNLKLNVTTEEIAKFVKEEKLSVKKKYISSPSVNLALITDDEKLSLIYLQKINRFNFKYQKRCDEFERKVDEMLDEHNIEYRDILEGDYRYFYQKWIEDEGYMFDQLWDMMKTVIEEYEYPFATYHMLYVLFEFQYA